MQQLPPELIGLAQFRQFIVWMAVSDDKPGKAKKLPINPRTLEAINPHDPDYWLDADSACRDAEAIGGGVGFVLTHQDPFFFLDIDDCLMADGRWSPRAIEMLDLFRGAGVEVSHSGRGLHIIGSGACPPHSCKNLREHMELYTESRFVALTGQYTDGSVLTNCTRALEHIVREFFTPKAAGSLGQVEWSEVPVPGWKGPWDDDVLINKAMSGSSVAGAFGAKATFAQLFNADVDALADHYPSSTPGMSYDESSADMALACHLAFWTGKNHERIKNIMLRSNLVRGKWDREDYLIRTIQNACAMQTDVYTVDYRPPQGQLPAPPPSPHAGDAKPPVNVGESAPAPLPQSGHTTAGIKYMPAFEQIDYFRGCVYIRDSHRVLTPDGALLKPDQFRSMYAGYTFAMDLSNSKTTKSAWEAFIESQALKFPKANRYVFRPELPPLHIFDEEGESVVNCYVPVLTKRRKGDPKPFLDLLEKLLPNRTDREVLLSYMAAIVQYPGVKFQWCPVVQGVEGNGKTTLVRCVAFAVGYRYSYFPNAMDLSNKFNSWLANKLFIGIEELYVGDKQELMDCLKPMITNTTIEIQRKGVDQERIDNRANFMATTNHQDWVRATGDKRRWCVLYTAQQSKKDLHEYGMDGSYFPLLYRWLNDGGYEIVNDFLHEYPIADQFNPAGVCVTAPNTTATMQASKMAAGTIEQEIEEAIQMELQGFRDGWVSSIMLDRLLQNRRLERFVPRNRRRALLQGMGYDWHPALTKTQGRTLTPILQEGGKPVLFCKVGVPPPARDGNHCRELYMIAQGYEKHPTEYPIPKVG